MTVYAIEGNFVKGSAEGISLWPFGLHTNFTDFHRKWIVR
jgi:hypothetical protein